jgi:hypothetical protein
MNRTLQTAVAAIALSFAGTAAFAQANNGPVTREQVKAELAAAIANGQVNFFDDLAYMQPLRTGNPASAVLAHVREGAQRVAATQAGSGLTREQVKAELAAARRSGELNPFDNLDGVTYRQAPRAAVAPSALAQSR